MELQINQFWILKGHSTINSVNEYELDELDVLMNYSIYLWDFRIVILNFYFIFNLIFIVRRSWIFFIETARYKFEFIIINLLLVVLFV